MRLPSRGRSTMTHQFNSDQSKALRIVLSYDPLNPGKTPPEEFEFAKSQGMLFDPVSKTHDEAVAWLFAEKERAERKHITDAFLASLSSQRSDWRSGLGAYAIAQSFPKHEFSLRDGQELTRTSPCKV